MLLEIRNNFGDWLEDDGWAFLTNEVSYLLRFYSVLCRLNQEKKEKRVRILSRIVTHQQLMMTKKILKRRKTVISLDTTPKTKMKTRAGA